MDTFQEIVDNALTSREEVIMVSDAQIGAEHDIDREATQVWTGADALIERYRYARYQAFMMNGNPEDNPFGLR